MVVPQYEVEVEEEEVAEVEAPNHSLEALVGEVEEPMDLLG